MWFLLRLNGLVRRCDRCGLKMALDSSAPELFVCMFVLCCVCVCMQVYGGLRWFVGVCTVTMGITDSLSGLIQLIVTSIKSQDLLFRCEPNVYDFFHIWYQLINWGYSLSVHKCSINSSFSLSCKYHFNRNRKQTYIHILALAQTTLRQFRKFSLWFYWSIPPHRCRKSSCPGCSSCVPGPQCHVGL